MSVKTLAIGLLLTAATLPASAPAQGAAELPQVKPEAAGFSSQRLRRLDAVLQRMVDEHQIAGIVTVAARHGQIIHSGEYGLRDIDAKASMTKDTLFRIYSMTKPVTGVAMMMLYEEGRWHPQDPISKHIPEFAHLKVLKNVDSSGNMQLEDPVHPPTMRELMTHTAGFTYGVGQEPVDKLYRDARGRNAILTASSPQEMIDRLAQIPLAYQPGTRWVYGVSVDIQGYLVERLSGRPLSSFMKERIFQPLGMTDTGFYVPRHKRDRFATLYDRDDKDAIVPAETKLPIGLSTAYDAEPVLPLGGTSLVSTAGDYLRFVLLLSRGGELGGVRLLSPQILKMMTANHLPPSLMTGQFGAGPLTMRPGHGFGYDVAVYTDPALADSVVGKGTFYWVGGAGTWFWIDPANDIVFVGMAQSLAGAPSAWDLLELTQQTFYQALVETDERTAR